MRRTEITPNILQRFYLRSKSNSKQIFIFQVQAQALEEEREREGERERERRKGYAKVASDIRVLNIPCVRLESIVRRFLWHFSPKPDDD